MESITYENDSALNEILVRHNLKFSSPPSFPGFASGLPPWLGTAPFANAQASIQIEMAAFTGGGKDSTTTTDVWPPKEGVLLHTVAILAFCAGGGIDIPLQVPTDDWKDDNSDMPSPRWAGGPTKKNPKKKTNARAHPSR